METENALVAALEYAARGWPVFPCQRWGKTPLTKHGLKDATTDSAQIRALWQNWPGANVGLATGQTSGLVVVDDDPRHGGNQTLATLEQENGSLPTTLAALTGGGGMHLFFAANGTPVRNSAGKLGPGLGVRGDGGYVVAPPSVHESGRVYEWLRQVEPAPLPEWLARKLAEAPPNGAAAQTEEDYIPEGQRNDALEAALLTENQRRCRPPLPEREVRDIAASVSRYPVESTAALKKPLIQIYTAAELVATVTESVEFLAYPFAVRGIVALLDGAAKSSGKTTLTFRAFRAMLRGDLFLNQATQYAHILLVTEEGPRTIKEALRRAGLEEETALHIIPWTSLAGIPWSALMEFLEAKCRELDVKLLVIDTLYAIAKLQAEEENQAAVADTLVAPLRSLAATLNLAVVLTRHERKSGGMVGQSGRGSGALTGAVDIVLQLRRPEGKHPSTIRQLDILSRLDLPDRLLIELDGFRYISLGERADVKTATAEETILKHTPGSSAGAQTESQILRSAGLSRTKPVRAAFAHLKRKGELKTMEATVKGRQRTAFYKATPEHGP